MNIVPRRLFSAASPFDDSSLPFAHLVVCLDLNLRRCAEERLGLVETAALAIGPGEIRRVSKSFQVSVSELALRIVEQPCVQRDGLFWFVMSQMDESDKVFTINVSGWSAPRSICTCATYGWSAAYPPNESRKRDPQNGLRHGTLLLDTIQAHRGRAALHQSIPP